MCLTDHLTDDRVRPAIEALAKVHAAFTKLADMADQQRRDGRPEAAQQADECRKLAREMDLAAGRLVK